ncbi:MAG: aldehyde dehydrogenase family protein [Caulobacterales bacterium]|nr:aldehyde dehydrogenase family protein [Caulobacterales bacterium]
MEILSISPIDGKEIGSVATMPISDIEVICAKANQAFIEWRKIPPPIRGEFIRIWGNILREKKLEIANLITLEAGKTISESLGEVQEMIDMADFATGLSRQLYGLTIASERSEHHLIERYKPIGPVLIISAFNFPVAVFAWNAALAIICGNSIIWKPSEKTPLCAKIIMDTLEMAARAFSQTIPKGLFQIVFGDKEHGAALIANKYIRLVSATGSTRMGKEVAKLCAQNLKRNLLELGGNGAMIIRPSADLDLAIRAIVFAACGTAGQRCTSLRRIILHPKIKDEILSRLIRIYENLTIGDPRKDGILIGPLIDEAAYNNMQSTINEAKAQGGNILIGGQRCGPFDGFYVKPAIIEIDNNSSIIKTETFAPILFALSAESLEEAIAINNDVPQGLSSAIFTNDLREAEIFMSACGSDCGIANVNIGTSGAEIGGAFGGEKETGGGREAGSDAWKAYMIRQTQTINYSNELPLAQGVRFDI